MKQTVLSTPSMRLTGRLVRLHVLVGLAICPLTPRLVPAVGTARSVVQETTDQVIGVLEDKNLTTEQKRHQVESIVYAHFDFDTLSRLTLARNWKQLTPEQQKQSVDEFKRHLAMTYGKNIETYNGEHATVIAEHAESDGDWTVKTRITRPNAAEILVDYRLRQADGRWHVVDVIIEGVSLVANYRSQFQEIVARNGPEQLVQLLREKNVKGQPLKSE